MCLCLKSRRAKVQRGRVRTGDAKMRRLIHIPARPNVTAAGVFGPQQTWRTFAVILAVLGALYAALELAVRGPFAMWTFELAVVQPVESAYGFEAEWERVGGYEYLIIGKTVPGGRFDKAGIKPGYAFAPARCGWFALAGGWYALLFDAEGSVSVALQTIPGDVTTERFFDVL